MLPKLPPLPRSFPSTHRIKGGVPDLTISYHPSPHALFFNEKSAIDRALDVEGLKIREKIASVPLGTLRWKFQPNTSVGKLPLSTQRQKLRKKWNHAFKKALSRSGMREDGRVKDKNFIGGLEGTMEVAILNGCGYLLDEEELNKQAILIVKVLLNLSEKKRVEEQGWRPVDVETKEVEKGLRHGKEKLVTRVMEIERRHWDDNGMPEDQGHQLLNGGSRLGGRAWR